jgi:hypothetical protein
MLLSAFGNLPWKTRSILVQNEDSFRGLIEAAMKSLGDGTLDKVQPVRMRYFTGQDVPITGQHFLTYRWDKTSIANGTFGFTASRCQSFSFAINPTDSCSHSNPMSYWRRSTAKAHSRLASTMCFCPM